MQNIIQRVFKAKKATQKLHGITEGTIWRTATDDPDEDDARDTLAIKEAGFKRSDFFKPVRVDHLVVDDMPAEGVFDTAFCDRYKLAEDGKSWLLPAAQPNPAGTDTNNQEQGNENTTNITDSGDTASAAVTDSETTADTATSASDKADADSVNDVNVNGEPMNEVEKDMDWPMKDLPLSVRWMAQKGMGSKVLFLRPAERERLTKILEAEDWNNNQHLINIKEVTTSEIAPEIDKLTPHHLHRLVTAFDKVSEKVERMGPFMAKRFVRAWLDTEYIDQGILVNEWCAGRHVARIEKPTVTSISEVPATQKTPTTEVAVTARPRRSEKPTYRTINRELGCGFYDEDLDYDNLRPALDFAKRIIAEDREDWKRMSMTVGIIPGIKNYDRKTIIDLVRKAPKAVLNGSPELRRIWCESFLAVHGVLDPDWYEYVPDEASTTHEENAARIRRAGKALRDIEEGRFQCDEEKPQPAGELADEQTAPETVEQDTTEHHPDPQPLDAQSQVDPVEVAYQKKRAELHEARKNIPPKNPVDFGKQLAAARGEYVEGISDPDDPKWVHNDYNASANASNEGEKTEVATDRTEDTADGVDHSAEFSNQVGQETRRSGLSTDSTDHNESEAPETPETSEPDNDERSSYCGGNERQERKGDDTCQTEILHLLRDISEDLKKIDARQARAERQRKRMMAAVCLMATTLTEDETEEDNNHDN
ncbi:hypothetical protein H0L72_004298 [Salmonella enterica]|nr:hypothetical protein [Salmonella enterica]